MSGALSEADIPALADRVMSLLMTQQLGPELDLRDLEGQSELARFLSRAFEAPYAPLLAALQPSEPPGGDAAEETPETAAAGEDAPAAGLDAVLRMLVAQNAALQADLFLIKAALQRDNRYVSDYAGGYRDPLVMARRLMEETRPEPVRHRAVTLFVPFDSRVMGSGWHEVQTGPDGRAFRWSSRHRDVSVVLPAFGPGRHVIEMDYEVLLPEQLGEIVLEVDNQPVEITREAETEKTGTLRFETAVPPGRSTAFQMLDISIGGPVRPSDYGLDDTRVLGFKTHGFGIAYAGSET